MCRNLSVLLLALLCAMPCAHAQGRAGLKPRWIGGASQADCLAYYLVVVHSDAAGTLDGARSSILKELSANVERTNKVSVTEIFEDNSSQRYSGNSSVTSSGVDNYSLEIRADGASKPIHSRRIDEYWKSTVRGGVPVLDYYAVYAVERNGQHADFSSIRVTDRYGVSGLWRSAIIPGWGQFHKGTGLKGGLILGGCAALAGGIIFFDNQRSDYSRKISGTHDASLIKSYSTKRDHYATARNVCVGAAVALYAYNLIDAVAASGARRLVVGNGKYSVMPGVSPYGTPVVAASINF